MGKILFEQKSKNICIRCSHATYLGGGEEQTLTQIITVMNVYKLEVAFWRQELCFYEDNSNDLDIGIRVITLKFGCYKGE